VFASTKTATNDQIGCLGLGSKSPFSYTDSFTVNAYDGYIKRVYLAALNSDGIPTITHLTDEPSDEARGLEITFAVASGDIDRFRKAAENVVVGFDPAPEIVGATITAPEPKFVGDGLRIYRRKNTWDYSGNNGLTDHMIKMGPVAYPLPGELAGPISETLNTQRCIMLDVPVGSVDFTANREALQLTPQTRSFLTQIISENMERLKATAFNDIADPSNTYLDACRSFYSWNTLIRTLNTFRFQNNSLAPIVSNTVEFNSRLSKDLVLKSWGSRTVERVQTRQFGIHVQNLSNMTFVINRDPKMSRRMVRFKAFSESKSNVYWLDHPTNDQIMRLMRCFDLKREQFIPIENLPDVEVEANSSSGGGGSSVSADTLRGAFRMSKHAGISQISSTTHEIITNDDYYWIYLETTKPNDDFRLPKCGIAADMSDRSYRRDAITALAKFLDIDIDKNPILLLGKQARKKLDVSEDRLLDNVMYDLMTAKLPEYLKMSQAGNGKPAIKSSVLDILNMDSYVDLPVVIHRELINTYGEDKVNEVHPNKSKYPLLFASRYPDSSDIDDAAITEYIQFINNK
jgi:hypothetical protein